MTQLRFDRITRSFPGVKALDGVSFEVVPGTIHALIGENGAGKSTILKTLGGEFAPDAGQILLDGVPQSFRGSADAIRAGIAIIHQELQYVPELTVAENLMLGRLPRRWGLVHWRAMHETVKAELARMGIAVHPDARMEQLSIGARQMVEIAKALMRHARVLAFDEPTSSLSLREVEVLFGLLRELRRQGASIIYVSHRLDEIYDICDGCTVLRDGRVVAEHARVAEVPRTTLVTDMVGRKIGDVFGWRPRNIGAVCLEVQDLQGKGLRAPVSLSLRRGEILGCFGLVGAGRTELCRLLYGIQQPTAGTVRVDGQPLLHATPASAIRHGLVLCPEDRKLEGIVGGASVSENINLSARRHWLRLRFFLNHSKERSNCDHFIEALRIRTPHREQLLRYLSGGNQQKVVIARWLAESGISVYVMDEPTRGIDVGAKHEIYQLMYSLAEQGHAVLMISSELPEVLGVADRIAVMRDGAISGVLERSQASESAVMELALPRSHVALPGVAPSLPPEAATPATGLFAAPAGTQGTHGKHGTNGAALSGAPNVSNASNVANAVNAVNAHASVQGGASNSATRLPLV